MGNNDNKLNIEVTPKQQEFMEATQSEVLYGGAAGGGKSHGQVLDAMLYALKYKGSRQLMLRRTMPELRRSLILKSFEIIPNWLADYKRCQGHGSSK